MVFLSVENVSYTYPKTRQETIRGISFTLSKGEAVSLMGPNGSGKTTLGKILARIYKATKGSVLLYGKDITDYTLGEVGKHIGYIFQNPEKQLFAPTVEEEVSFGLRFRGIKEEIIQEKVKEILSYFDLLPKRGSFPFNLSQGEKQRLAIAAAFVMKPEFMIFDEPTTGLDIKRRKVLLKLLNSVRAQGTGYLLISHDDEFCDIAADRTLYLKDGKIL